MDAASGSIIPWGCRRPTPKMGHFRVAYPEKNRITLIVNLLTLVALLRLWAGATLLIDPGCAVLVVPTWERLRPFQPPSVADEAQDWLQRQG